MMPVTYPVSTKLLTEARLYAKDSIQHTMDYDGWEDQHKKQDRITYGKFGQVWVAEFCRLNDIPYEKDRSSPTQSDELDLTIAGKRIDVKTTVFKDLVGQVSPGVIDKHCDEYCFLVTDKECNFVTPIGFVSHSDYKAHSVFVPKGEIIPGTSLPQRFSRGSYFLPPGSFVLRPFVRELLNFMNNKTESEKQEFPIMLIESSQMEICIERISALEQAFIAETKTKQEILRALYLLLQPDRQLPHKRARSGNVVGIRNGVLFEEQA